MQLSDRGTVLTGVSGVRSILDDIAAAGAAGGTWLNLSPGNPARIPEVTDTWRRLAEETVRDAFERSSGQYGPAAGTDELRDAVAGYFADRYGWPLRRENVLVGPGSQVLCFAAATAYAGPRAGALQQLVLPSVPDYTGYQGLVLDPGGVVGVEPDVRLVGDRHFRYTVDMGALRRQESVGLLLLSSPANPSARGLEPAELAALTDLAARWDVPLLIDHAYGEPFPGIAEVATEPPWHPNVVNCFTLSKAGLPGERVGFAVGPAEVLAAMSAFTGNCLLHGPQLVQAVVARALSRGELDALASKVIGPYYRRKRALAEELLHELLPCDVDWRLHVSSGGLFCWLWIDHDWFDDLAAYAALKRRRVFAVPGRHFFVPPLDTPFLAGHATRCLRLSLSAEEPVVAEGVRRLGEVMRELAG